MSRIYIINFTTSRHKYQFSVPPDSVSAQWKGVDYKDYRSLGPEMGTLMYF